VGFELDQQRAQQQIARQIERFSSFCLKRQPQFLLAPPAGHPAQISRLQLQGPIPGNRLCRIPVALDKVRTQDFVSPDDFVEASFQRGDVERARQPHGLAKVIDRTARLQAVEKPEPLLSVGKRQVFPLRAVWNYRSLAPLPGGVKRTLEAFFQQRLLGIGQLPPRQRQFVSDFHDRWFANHAESPAPARRSASSSDNSLISRTSVSSIAAASSVIAGASKKRRKDTSTWNASRTRVSTCMTSSEWPPNSKKLS